jgi:tetratricopeptide (TPR) repeat protein
LHFFIGREAFWLREDDLAIHSFNEALRLKPNYANAYMGLGALHYDRAQRFYTPNPIPPELAPCFSEQDVARGAQSPQEVSEEVDRSIAYLQEALAIAPDSPWPPIESTAHLILGNAYRLKGQSLLLDAELSDGGEQSQAWFTQALAEFSAAESAFTTAKQQQYLSWTHLGKGATYLLQAYAALSGVDNQEKVIAATSYQAAAALFQQADEECQRCLDEGKTVADLVYQRKVLRCGCELLQERAQLAHAEVLKLLEEQ